MNKWSEYLNKHYDNSKQIEVDKGDLVSLNLVQPGNEIVNQNIISPNGTSDLVYGKGFAQHIDLKSFYDTGDLSNLPIINNKPLLPTLRVNFLEDK